jgi:hypothetical protein
MNKTPLGSIVLLFSFLLLSIAIFATYNSYYSNQSEKFSQEMQHKIAHFGGTPNNSQIWPYLVKYPKEYV